MISKSVTEWGGNYLKGAMANKGWKLRFLWWRENLNIKERKEERTERWVEGEGGMN